MMQRFSDPFTAMLALQRALESRRESEWMRGGTVGRGAYPPINIFQQKEDFVAIIELPGIAKDNLQIQAKENTIRISGEKTVGYDERASAHRRERVFGVFDRTISLPVAIDPDAVRAEYRDGILVLFVPRAASEKPRSIKVS
jgi:HSP20 family protein